MDLRKIVILYGSETGTAQDLAERIWRDSRRFFFCGPVLPMDEYPINELIFERLVVFVCSTTGEGEEPRNMKKFWKFLLRKNLPSDSLQNLRFSVLGLGDSSYSKFNFAAKKLYRRLKQLGATPLTELGLADDQHDLGADGVIEPWLQTFWKVLTENFPLPPDKNPIESTTLMPPRWNVSVSSKHENLPRQNDRLNILQLGNPHFLSVKSNVKTTSTSHFQDVRLIKFSSPPSIHYSPGDVLMVQPCNLAENVKKMLELMELNTTESFHKDSVLHVTERDSDMKVPPGLREQVTLRQCVEQYWDLSAIPTRYFFYLLSFFTTSDLEREKLIEFTSPEGQQELYDYCNRPRRTALEVLCDFPHATPNIPIQYLFDMFRPIRPRAFSIASSPQAHCGEIHILVAVVKYKTILSTPRYGLCSNWLANLGEGSIVPACVQRGSFKFALKQETPVIMIGPGTGVAPFRSYIHEKAALGEASERSLYLFFGCRNCKGDFHCKDEWLSLVHSKQLSLFCAFSRDQDHKIYVQHVISEHRELVWNLLSCQRASIYLAGNAKSMPAAVKEAICSVIKVQGKLENAEADKYFEDLENSGRFQTETWS